MHWQALKLTVAEMNEKQNRERSNDETAERFQKLPPKRKLH